jgi:transposase InsO family protein
VHTYLRCREGVVFVAFVIDIYSRRIVGRQLAALLSDPAGAHELADAAREETTARRSARVRRSSTRRGC